jgi:phosphoribosylanthranilate isomerase
MLKGRADLPDAFIAGGIGPANARAAASLGAHGIDVGSGVEAAPGIKDAARIKALFAALRPAARSDA